jgi:GR25 family glycosyltransferase involved in LPS biosynthesis
MKSYAIVLKNHSISELGFENLVSSSKTVHNQFDIQRFDAITPDVVDLTMQNYMLKWNYPWKEPEYDTEYNILKKPYTCIDQNKKIACALSHFVLWHQCVMTNEAILILEHDSIFVCKLDPNILLDSSYEVIGINDPRKATRLAMKYHQEVQKHNKEIQEVPWIDHKEVPQGLAGASAYIVKPNAAKKILYTIYTKTGLWHNDALLCKQVFDFLGTTRAYYTKVQGLESTTSK